MSLRAKRIRTTLLVIFAFAVAAASFGSIWYELRALDREAAASRRALGLASARAARLDLEASHPGGWRAKGGYLYRGKERLVEAEAIRGALADALPPGASVTFGVGDPPAPIEDEGRGAAKAGLPFVSALGACVALPGESGATVGWIAIGSGADRGRALGGLRLAAVLGLAGLFFAAIILLGAAALRLARPIDLAAEADEASRSKAEDRARRDPLTGLLNRRGLVEAAKDPLSMHGLSHVAVLDIDDFRAIGDERGDEACDRLLREIALTIVSIVRGADLCGRWEEDEFIVVYRSLAEESLMIASERLRSGIAARDYGSPRAPLRVTVTLGIAEIGGRGFEGAAAAAEAAMRAGKAEGRNRTVFAARGI